MVGYTLFNCFIEDAYIGHEKWSNNTHGNSKIRHDGFELFMKVSKPGDTVAIPDLVLDYTVCGMEFQAGGFGDDGYPLDMHPSVRAKVARVANEGGGVFRLECEDISGALEVPKFTAKVVNGDTVEFLDLPTEE
jgi:hypothetical protein